MKRLADNHLSCYFLFFCNPHPRACLLILERGEVGDGQEGERERGTSMSERNIHRLSPACAPTGDRTCNLHRYPDWNQTCDLLFDGTKLPPTEPHQAGQPPLVPERSTPSGEPLECGNGQEAEGRQNPPHLSRPCVPWLCTTPRGQRTVGTHEQKTALGDLLIQEKSTNVSFYLVLQRHIFPGSDCL